MHTKNNKKDTYPEKLSRIDRKSSSWRGKRKEKKALIKEKRKNRHWTLRIVGFICRHTLRIVLVGTLIGSIGAYAGYRYYKTNLESNISQYIREGYEISENIKLDDFESVEPTVMKDKNGNVIRTFKDRNYVHLDIQENDELYQRVSDVTTTIEDARFYQHQGFDYLGVGVAVINHFVSGADLRGASTLTQQLVKNTYLNQEQTMSRKVTEAVIAQEVENQFSKRQILEFYLNNAYFGRGNYGLETAAKYYFGRTAEELDYTELATLISIPNNPTVYDPINNPNNTMKRRNLILTLLGEEGILKQEEVISEKDKEISLNITPMSIDNSLSDWAESFAMNRTVEEMMKLEGFEMEYWQDTQEERDAYKERYNSTYERHSQKLMRGGFVIETGIDSEMQASLQSQIDNNLKGFTRKDDNGILVKQAPAVVIDNRSNEVVAIVGGRSQENNTSFNRAFQSARQPGSSIKPFLSYAPAFEKGLATGTNRNDAEIKNGPKNWYTGYRGNMTLRYAMEQSVNTIAYNLLQEVGLDYGRQKLIDMEFSNLRPDDKYPTLAVGGWTQGTSPIDIASAFNTLVNDGQFYKPSNLRRITSSDGQTVFYDSNNVEPKQVYESGVGYVTLNAMQSTVKEGTAKSYSFGYEYEAGKTGTTNDLRELWYVGGTPYYTMSLYIGDDNPAYQERSTVGPVIESIYSDYMRKLHKDLDVIDFEKPNTVVEQNNNLWVRTNKDEDPQKARLANEITRKETVRKEQLNRLKSLAYRIKHGLTFEQAVARERVAEARVLALENYSLNGSEDLSKANAMKLEAQEAISEVVRDDKKSPLTTRLNSAYNSVKSERASILAEKERQIRLREELERRQKEIERIEKAQKEEANKEVESVVIEPVEIQEIEPIDIEDTIINEEIIVEEDEETFNQIIEEDISNEE